MIRRLAQIGLVVLSLTVLAACSDKGSPVGRGLPNEKPTADGEAGEDKSGVTTAGPLTANAWCLTVEEQGQAPIQERFKFNPGGKIAITVFAIENGARGQESGQATGNWSLNGTNLKGDANGNAFDVTVRIDPQDAQTGAAKLHLTSAQGDTAMDPCN